MKVVRLTPESFSKVVKETVKVLLSCGVVVTPTDTCYGLMADIRNVRAVEKIYEIKKRPRNKPLPILVSSVEMAGKYGELDEVALELIRKFMPGPLTVVVKKKEAVPDIVNPINAALRIPNNKFVLAVVEGLGGAVTGTSANRSGDKPPYTVEDVKKSLGDTYDEVNLVVDAGKLRGLKPSTVVDLTARGIAKITRVGPVKPEEVERVVKRFGWRVMAEP